MVATVRVIGRGRVGAALAARLDARGLLSEAEDADLVLLAVPDAAIATVAGALPAGPWIAHLSGATPLASLAPHARRFGVHPLQTFVRWRGAEQLDGAWAAVTAESDLARAHGHWLASTLGLTPFDLDERRRALYHAGAAMASNFLVTLHHAAARAVTLAGAPAAALVPLMTRTIDNHFELTGPIARGDLATIDAHRAALGEHAPDLAPLYDAFTALTRP